MQWQRHKGGVIVVCCTYIDQTALSTVSAHCPEVSLLKKKVHAKNAYFGFKVLISHLAFFFSFFIVFMFFKGKRSLRCKQHLLRWEAENTPSTFSEKNSEKSSFQTVATDTDVGILICRYGLFLHPRIILSDLIGRFQLRGTSEVEEVCKYGK